MSWIPACVKNRTPRLLHEVILPPSFLSPDWAQQPSQQQVFVLKYVALLEKPTYSTVGCSQPWGAASLAYTKKADKHRCIRKSDKGARQESREKEPGKRKPQKASQCWWGLGNLIRTPFHVFILFPHFNKESWASSWDGICQAKIFQFFLQTHQVALLKISVFLRNT